MCHTCVLDVFWHTIRVNALLSPLFCRLSSVDIGHIQANLEDISTFQQMLVQSLEEHTKSVYIYFLSLYCACNIFEFWLMTCDRLEIDWMDAWMEFGLTGQFVSDRHFFLLWTLLALLNKVWLLYLQVVNYTCSICFSELWLSYNFSIAFLKHAQYSDELPMFTSCCTKITQTSSCPEWTFMLAIIVTTATSIGHMKSYNRFFQFGQVHDDDNDFFGG